LEQKDLANSQKNQNGILFSSLLLGMSEIPQTVLKENFFVLKNLTFIKMLQEFIEKSIYK